MKSLFSKDPKQELEVVMTCLMFICFCCLLISFIQNAMLCFDLGKDDTDDFLWIMLPQSVTLLAMAVCSILIFCLLRNVKRKEVFTKENSTLIVAIGGTEWVIARLFRNFCLCEQSPADLFDLYFAWSIYFIYRMCIQDWCPYERGAGTHYLIICV